MTEKFVCLSKQQAEQFAEAIAGEIAEFVASHRQEFEKFLEEEAEAGKGGM